MRDAPEKLTEADLAKGKLPAADLSMRVCRCLFCQQYDKKTWGYPLLSLDKQSELRHSTPIAARAATQDAQRADRDWKDSVQQVAPASTTRGCKSRKRSACARKKSNRR